MISYDFRWSEEVRCGEVRCGAVKCGEVRLQDAVFGTTNAVYGTTNADAGVGIGMKRGIQKI